MVLDDYFSDDPEDGGTGSPGPREVRRRWLLLTFAVLVLLGAFIIGTAVLLPYHLQVATASSAALEFLGDIEANRMDAAYERTTPKLRQQLSRQQFDALVARYPALTRIPPRSYSLPCSSEYISDGHARVEVTIQKWTENDLSLTLDMIQEGGRWRVDRFTIP